MQHIAIITGVSRVSTTFEDIVRQREAQILRVAYRMLGNWADAEDVAQEAFVKLHRHGLGFANDAAMGSWLYRVAVNVCMDRLRASRPSLELTEVAAGSANAEATLQAADDKRLLMAAMAQLPERERAAVVLREIEELSTAEVAAILGSTEVTVRSQVSKAIGRLRQLLGGK